MRPLLITDCDEVLLHMVRHFRSWLDEEHAIDLTPGDGDFSTMLTRRDGSPPPNQAERWELVEGFFPAEMHRQTLAPYAAESLAAIARVADIVVLTNLGEQCRQPRIEQLAAFGISHRVQCNSGGKGEPVARLVEEFQPSVTVFVDDLGPHHESVAEHAAGVWRLQMVAEPSIAPHVSTSPAAHARIDDWRDARLWIASRFTEGRAAEA